MFLYRKITIFYYCFNFLILHISDNFLNSVRPIDVLCVEKRIPGAVKIGYSWVIPADAEKPKDARVKSGKYIKSGTWPN